MKSERAQRAGVANSQIQGAQAPADCGPTTLQLRDKNTLFLVCMGLPVIVFFGLSSLRRAAEANWPWRSMTFDIPSSSRGRQAVAIHGF
ncbi:MAG: hypothetical protein NTU86_10935 [Burkholderiales bacterium]|nr:hypothetical protein [Burkholderiales bacterium]